MEEKENDVLSMADAGRKRAEQAAQELNKFWEDNIANANKEIMDVCKKYGVQLQIAQSITLVPQQR